MSEIVRIVPREILDSRGDPTVEVELFTKEFSVRAAVPSGASTGKHEAVELRDGGKRYRGKGVLSAIENINMRIAPKLIGLDVTQQQFIDVLMTRLDSTPNKAKLGANAVLAVSLAVCRAGAKAKNMKLYNYLSELAETTPKMPIPYFNIINGGKHAGNLLDIQEYMIVPVGAEDFKEALMMGSEVYHALKKILEERYGIDAVNVGDEGGFAPPIKDNEAPLLLIEEAIRQSGYRGKIKIALDCAASEFYRGGKYVLGSKAKAGQKELDGKELAAYYMKLLVKYPILSIEDPFAEDDFESWSYFMKKAGVTVIGDDLLVTNIERIKLALEKNACNALLLKINQIGTVTEAIQAAKLAFGNNWKVMVSHRSGETEDTFIADLAVGLGCGQIKAGAPCRGERVAKYNQLLRIEAQLT